MNITSQMVKELREKTNAGMMDCKKALTDTDGDMEKAVDLLRQKGLAVAAKRAGKETREGVIEAYIHAGGKIGVMVEVACETDFVAKSDKFIALGNAVLQALADSGAETVDAALAAKAGNGTVESLISDEAAILGEKIELRRLARIPGNKFAVYLHRTSKDLPPQVGVVVAFEGDDAETIRSVAQHISFADPQYLTRDEVPAETVENERRIAEEISRGEGKPEAALPRIVEGRVGGYYKDVVLVDQPAVWEDKKTVGAALQDSNTEIVRFVRFAIGA